MVLVSAGRQPLAAVFDTHAHLISGDPDRYPPAPMHGTLRAIDMGPPFDADELLARMDEAGVTRACAVQRGHVYGYDNSYVLDSARRFPDRLTPVVMLHAATDDTASTLRRMAGEQRLGGVRFAAARIIDDDTGWFNSPAAMRVWEVAAELRLPVALIVFARHRTWNLPALAMIAASFPDVPIVVDHIGVPHGSNYEVAWTRDRGLPAPYLGAPDFGIDAALLALRRHRNVRFKLTGINAERFADNGVDPAAFVRRFVDEFGAERLMWGSDIGQTAGPYGRLVDEARAATANLDPGERRQVLSGTAEAVYGW